LHKDASEPNWNEAPIRENGEQILYKDVRARIEGIIAQGGIFVLSTGRRLQNYLAAAAILPHTYGIIESGGLIVLSENPNHFDQEWWGLHSRTLKTFGAKEGVLWEYNNSLRCKGFRIGDYGRFASFRVIPRNANETAANLYEVISNDIMRAGLVGVLVAVVSEGCVDVIPATSGKLNAAKYLREKLARGAIVHAVGDSESDFDLLEFANHAYCPAGSIPEVKALVMRKGGYIPSSTDESSTSNILERILINMKC
jgi:hydroxymethylpyrimidine pyrophosphatase-like HAD family hydrolase